MPRRFLLVAAALGALSVSSPALTVGRAAPARAPARASTVSKCITSGPDFRFRSVMPTLRQLGVRTWEVGIVWPLIAPHRPTHPTDPRDRAYHWPAEEDQAVAQAARLGIETVIYVNGFASWANGGKDLRWVSNPRDFAQFMVAVVKHYRLVRRFVIFSEPTHYVNFEPQGGDGRAAPHAYARILDAAYGAMHAARKDVVVIGGNMHPSGVNDDHTTAPDTFLQNLVLPSGRRPRLDQLGVNPYTERPINLALPKRPHRLDFDDLDWLSAQLDRIWPGRHVSIFIGEFGWNTEHGGSGWLYVVPRDQQAQKLRQAFQQVQRLPRVDTLCWAQLYDSPPQKSGSFYLNWTSGLATFEGAHKPSWSVFASMPGGPRRITPATR